MTKGTTVRIMVIVNKNRLELGAMNQIDAVIGDIKEMFAKQPNTIYEVRVVDQIYSKKVNIFFEWYKIGKATRSQQIARLDSSYTEQIPEIIKKIRKETGLTVRTNIYD